MFCWLDLFLQDSDNLSQDYRRLLPTEIIATRNLHVTGDIFVALFFSICRDITQFTLKEMLRPKQWAF